MTFFLDKTYKCGYCCTVVIILAFCGRRYECLAECKLIFRDFRVELFG